MTLATHAIVGAVVAQAASADPYVALSLAFMSHFALDAIPHWDYHLRSMSRDKDHTIALIFAKDHRFLIDLSKIGLDFLLGVIGTFLVFKILNVPITLIPILGLLMAVLPDFLQFVYGHFRNPVLGKLQHFHVWIHSKKRLDGRPVIGICSQLAVIALVVLGFWYF